MNTPSLESKTFFTVCAYCPDALQRTEDAIVAGFEVSHGICPACVAATEVQLSLTIPEVRAWGARLLAKLAVHKHTLEAADCSLYAAGVEWAMNELDGALRGFLDGMGPGRG